MKNLSSLLERFKNIRDPKKDREELARIMSSVLNFEILESNISLTKSEIKVKVSPTVRSQIFVNKEKIKEEIKKEIPKFSNFEIR